MVYTVHMVPHFGIEVIYPNKTCQKNNSEIFRRTDKKSLVNRTWKKNQFRGNG